MRARSEGLPPPIVARMSRDAFRRLTAISRELPACGNWAALRADPLAHAGYGPTNYGRGVSLAGFAAAGFAAGGFAGAAATVAARA